MDDRTLFRWGSWAAIVGGILALGFNLVHPRPESYDDMIRSEIEMVSGSGAWVGIHLGIFAAFLLITFGLFAVARSMKGGPAEGIARLATGSLLISTPIALGTLLIDGYTLKAVADVAARDAAMLPAATAAGHIGWALFAGTSILALGVTPAALGWALARDGAYPSWMGWAGVLFALGGVATGVAGLYTGSTETFWLLFTASSGLLTVWTIGLGVLLGRRAAAGAIRLPEGATARREATTATR